MSVQSAFHVLQRLDAGRFDPRLVYVDPRGRWHTGRPAMQPTSSSELLRMACDASQSASAILDQVDVVFPLIHGTLGEDGSLQGLLRMAGLPFVGSPVLASALAMDKDFSKRLLRAAGIAVAPFVCLRRGVAADFDALAAELGLPMFVKPANQGSSVGIAKVDTREAFAAALATAFEYDHKVLVEAAIVGREIECAVLGNDDPRASVCGEVIVHDDFYAYDTKYLRADGAELAIPAAIGEPASARIRQLAVDAYEVLECQGLARVDFFLKPDGEPVLNEVNTLPGFTQVSMYPKLWEATGLAYGELITRLIELALERHQRDGALRATPEPR
ncbi:D-alanine--D-alanine ligase [Xylophilus rhododendri]|uniref:D-alanine--D-alanine ligase n=1 Tax=Xylophilus rhododendri TaxID=2697032 RepID=UPI001E5D10C7|nr:D-alanine--D-alanine ligase [Xylophilus rhododendri]